ncbi:MAG: DUF1059 domain-containing protein [Oligoflexia bacterium]|jgi:predicted small metal-binding protein
MKTFQCRDVGMNCGWSCKATNNQEILKMAEEHVRKEHGMQKLDDATRNNILSHIKDAKVA